MNKYLVLLFFIFNCFSIYSQTVVLDKSENGGEVAFASDIRISYDVIDKEKDIYTWMYEPYYKCDMGLSAYKFENNIYYYITIIFSNNNHHLLRHLDHSIKIKTTKKTINLAYDIEAATLHEEKYELKRTGRKTYSGTVKIGADIERYVVKIEDPTSDEKEIKRTEPYKMTVVYNISESDLIELFKGIKSIKIKNAKVNNSLVSDGRSDVTYTYNNNEISDYLHRSYLLIQEKLNKK